MRRQRYSTFGRLLAGGLVLLLTAAAWRPLPAGLAAELSQELKSVPYGIVYETWHDNNWELFIAAADGSKQENLTRTPKIHELYPHVSPDGTKICFLCDEGEGAAKIRNVYYMNIDGSGRTLVATNGRDPCWRAALPMREMRREIRHADRAVDAKLVGCTPEYQALNQQQIDRGRFLSDRDLAGTDNVVVLAHKAAEILFPYEDPIGRTVQIGRDFYVVVGVVGTVGGSREAREHELEVYMPLSTLRARIADSKEIAYLKGELKEFTYTDYASKGIAIYDLATGRTREHPNKELFHLYNLCWSPDGQWFLATVHAGMGYDHAILAIEAEGTKVYNLKIPGCRPDISPDGKKVAWGPSDWALAVGDLDFSGPQPRVLNARDVVTSPEPMKVYHIDWSPDGKYVAYSRGPEKKRLGLIPEMIGVRAEGWDIYVADPAATNRVMQITTDGACNKEPDWVPVEAPKQ